MKQYAYHEYAAFFPMLERGTDEFSGLMADISEHGQLEPITLYKGLILDGRNRFVVCRLLGIEPKIREGNFKSDQEALAFVVSRNLHRRHLTPSQRAVVGLKLMALATKRAKERKRASGKAYGEGHPKKSAKKPTSEIQAPVPTSLDPELDALADLLPPAKLPQARQARDEVANLVGVSGRLMGEAQAVEKKRPDLLAPIIAGEKTVREAYREATAKPKPQRPAMPPEYLAALSALKSAARRLEELEQAAAQRKIVTPERLQELRDVEAEIATALRKINRTRRK